MWHTIRNPDGTWRRTYGLIESQETNNPGPFTAIACAGVIDSLHVVGLCNSQMWHTIRNPNGTWQRTYGLIESQETNDPGPFGAMRGPVSAIHSTLPVSPLMARCGTPSAIPTELGSQPTA
jgi:hypothetical protein